MSATSVPYQLHRDGTLALAGEIYLFGSNVAGIHCKGHGLVAWRRFGAEIGVGSGRAGDSYAIPTLRRRANRSSFSLPFGEMGPGVAKFLAYAKQHPSETFGTLTKCHPRC